MKVTTTLILLLVLSATTYAQIMFQKTYGGKEQEHCDELHQTNDGGYIIGASTQSFGAGSFDAYLVKTDSNGVTLWTKTYGKTNWELCRSVKQTADGGYILTGDNDGEYMPLIKTDNNGNLLWKKQYEAWNAGGHYVIQTNDGGYMVAGQVFSTTDYDIFLIRTDNNGDTLWTRSYEQVGWDNVESILETSDGGFLVLGTSYSTFGAGGSDVYLIRVDGSGNLIWAKVYGLLGNDFGESIKPTTDGGFIIAGTSALFATISYDIYLLKIDSSANLIWSKLYSGIGNDNGCSAQQTPDGGYIVAGRTNSPGLSGDFCLIKTDSGGDLVWAKNYGGIGGDELDENSDIVTSDGGYILAGVTAFDNGIYLIKTDSLGNSGCNETISSFVVSAPATVMNIHTTQVSYPNPAVTSPNLQVGTGGTEATLCILTNVEDGIVNSSMISVSPNPFTTTATITTSTEGHYTFILSDILGREASRLSFTGNRTEIERGNLPGGVYIYRLEEGRQLIGSGKVVVE